MRSAGHALLARASDELLPLLPAGLRVEGSGGKGVATFTPWIGVFDPDETETPQEGIYLVYIFAEQLDRVVLTLNQGVTKLRQRFPDAEARRRLRADADAVRAGLGDSAAGTADSVSFGTSRALQRAYEAGTIAAIEYRRDDLNDESRVVADLIRFVKLYQDAIVVKRALLQSEPGTVSSSSVERTSAGSDPLRHFAPKDDHEYVVHLVGQSLVKSRRHETLVRDYGSLAVGHGFSAATNVHPRDLTLVKAAAEWLIEAKVVYSGNATNAVRETIGQLLQYRHFLYPADSNVRMVALFTEPVGDAYVALLNSIGIQAVWKSPNGWGGCDLAAADGLVPTVAG